MELSGKQQIKEQQNIDIKLKAKHNYRINGAKDTYDDALILSEIKLWYLNCLVNALKSADFVLNRVLFKANFWNRHAKTWLNERQEKLLNKILDGFDGKLTSSKWVKIAKCSKDTAIKDINDLIEKGILRKDSAEGRSTNYELKGIAEGNIQ